MTGREPAGPAGGALAGGYPHNLAIGPSSAAGWRFREDFVSPNRTSAAGTGYGDLGWDVVVTGAGSAGRHQMTSSDTNAFGCIIIQATTTSTNQVVLHLGLTTDRPIYSEPPIGAMMVWGGRLNTSVVSRRSWVGLASVGLSPDHAGANTVDFIGFRQDTGYSSGQWYGDVRSGTVSTLTSATLGNDSVTAYTHMGWERTTAGYQFFTLDLSDRTGLARTNVGDPIDVHPTGPLTPIIGVQALANSTKGLVVDYVELGSRTRRS